jgi:hypothetical protein
VELAWIEPANIAVRGANSTNRLHPSVSSGLTSVGGNNQSKVTKGTIRVIYRERTPDHMACAQGRGFGVPELMLGWLGPFGVLIVTK